MSSRGRWVTSDAARLVLGWLLFCSLVFGLTVLLVEGVA